MSRESQSLMICRCDADDYLQQFSLCRMDSPYVGTDNPDYSSNMEIVR